MNSVIPLILIAQTIVIAYLVYVLLSKKDDNEGTVAQLLKSDITTLTDSVTKLKEGLSEQISEKLDRNNAQMFKQAAESAKIVREVTQKLTELDKTNKHVGDIAGELKTLQNVLQNPKQRGVLGEYYLQTVLENVLPKGSFQMQYRFKDGETVDAVVFVDRGKIIPIDSKFSLENYNRLVEAKDQIERDRLSALIKSDLKNRIDETSKYIRQGEDTLDMAFMFVPSEAIYYDLVINSVGTAGTSARDLVEYAFRDKKVIIVSPTTLLAYLQTVLQGLRSLSIEEKAKDIQKRVGELGRHVGGFESFMQKLGKSLGTTVNHFNSAHKELGKIDKDVVRIAETSPGVEPLLIDKPTDDE